MDVPDTNRYSQNVKFESWLYEKLPKDRVK